MHSLTPSALARRSRAAAAAATLALLAAACGGSASPELDTSSGPSAAESAAETPGDQPADDATDAPAAEAEGPQVDDGGDAGQEEEEAAAEPAPVEPHLFPDLDTVNVVDGSTVNLAAELAGGDTPVLLWFWAPH